MLLRVRVLAVRIFIPRKNNFTVFDTWGIRVLGPDYADLFDGLIVCFTVNGPLWESLHLLPPR